MSPEIITFPNDQRVFGLTLYDGEPRVIGDGHFFQCFCAVILILDLREKKIRRYPGQAGEIDREQKQKAVDLLFQIGMPPEISRELIEVVIDKIPGVIIRCKTRPYEINELPKEVRFGEHTGYDFELIRPIEQS